MFFGVPETGLVLARQVGEQVVIEADGRIVAVVELAEATPGHARLRIRAPRDVVIARTEVYGRRPSKKLSVPA